MAPFVKELEKHPKYCNLYLKIIVLKHPKMEMEEHPKGLKKIGSTHYNSFSTTQRPRQTPCMIPQNTNRMINQPN